MSWKNKGTIFKVNKDGTNFTKLLEFTGTGSTNGSGPNGSLTLSGSVLYGATSAGGSAGDGCLFSINTDGTGFNKFFDFYFIV